MTRLKLWHCAVLIVVLWPIKWEWATGEEHHSEAKQWLERMMRATKTLNYEGSFVYIQGQHLEAMHIEHSSGQDGERQHMTSLNGPLREVVVTNSQVTCLTPQQQVVFSDAHYKRSAFPISLPHDLNRLESFYAFKMLGDDRVAGQPTQIIAIQPLDKLRFGYRLWLARETGLVLRSALMDEQEQIVEQMMFTQVQLTQSTNPIDLPASPTQTAVNQLSNNKKTPDVAQPRHSHWQVTDLPAGFEQIMHNRLVSAPGQHAINHIVFSDGLITVSVFVEPLKGAEPVLEGPSRMGAMNAFGAVVNDHQVVVVGEVPAMTVQLIASSVHYDQEANP
ncbi:MAG: MucB/RseB C-terminal domain-containing protein [Candidatus Competibacteraceae bacterium]|jgi:sigma-E factor negative regulatory protein RseB|nr:MucB/RseB C-terminal domain-containing protein [Candidatus Competibacteraceae bacterium]